MTGKRAFTLIELLVVIAIISVLLAMFAPMMSHIMLLARIDICFTNMHQLSIAWVAYQTDNKRKLVNGHATSSSSSWAKYGNENPGNGNRDALITTAALYPWSRDKRIYLCPSDPVDHIRSYSIVLTMNGEGWSNPARITRYSEIKSHSNELVFVEESDYRSNSNMGSFIQEPKFWGRNRFVDYVANFHEGGDNMSFADGHAEHWKWEDSRTIQNSADEAFWRPDNGNSDLERLRKSMFNDYPGAY